MSLNSPWSRLLTAFVLFFSVWTLQAQQVQAEFRVSEGESVSFIGQYLDYYIDRDNTVDISNIQEQEFERSTNQVLNLGFSESDVWLRLNLVADKAGGDYFLNYAFPLVDSLWVYKAEGDQLQEIYRGGSRFDYADRMVKHHYFLSDLNLMSQENVSLYIKVRTSGQLIIPINVLGHKESITTLTASDYFKGIFYGILISMIIYNLIISIFTRDKASYYYVAYIFFIAISQAMLDGYMQRYITTDLNGLNRILVTFAPSLGGFLALQFAQVSLKVKRYSKLLYRGILILQGFYLAIALLSFFPFTFLYTLVDIAALLVGIYTLVFSSIIARKGNRAASFFLVAFALLLLSLVAFVFRNVGILPYNFFTNNILQIGFAIQVLLLSIALADRINTLRKEKELSQEQALRAAKENEELIKQQNIVLEQKVHERTLELEESNEELRVTLDNLKETQTQLVDAEKMASLGQLTAGIAHEINNPINFVTSNIAPLRRDLEDLYEIMEAYRELKEEDFTEALAKAKALEEELELDYLKTEITSLVDGINDGAIRTSEIVKGLRTFSRLDEDVVKNADLHENLESTLVLLNNKLKLGINIDRQFDTAIKEIECYPGKLNQVFMNILNNAIYAVENKVYEEGEEATITLKTERSGSEVSVTIADNGIGMSPETQKKVFDPFFTTKDVGQGTGLGMSIVYKIIQKHNGSLSMTSELGRGTEFVIHLPMTQPSEF